MPWPMNDAREGCDGFMRSESFVPQSAKVYYLSRLKKEWFYERREEVMAKPKTKDAACDPAERTTSDKPDSAAGGEESSERVPKTIITPVAERIGEGRNNLQRRAEWYQRRTGSGS